MSTHVPCWPQSLFSAHSSANRLRYRCTTDAMFFVLQNSSLTIDSIDKKARLVWRDGDLPEYWQTLPTYGLSQVQLLPLHFPWPEHWESTSKNGLSFMVQNSEFHFFKWKSFFKISKHNCCVIYVIIYYLTTLHNTSTTCGPYFGTKFEEA